MTICKYYLEGRCDFGNRCKNEHRQPSGGQYHTYNNNDRGGSSSLYSRLGYSTGSSGRNQQPPVYEEKTVRLDLSKDRPQYPYSVFAPGKEEPNLIEGTDFSPEELRLEFYNLRNIPGGEIQYQAGVRELQSKFDNQFNEINKDLRGALRIFENKKRQQEQTSSIFGASSSGNGGGSGFGGNQQLMMQQNNQSPSPSSYLGGQNNNQFMGTSAGSFGATTATMAGGSFGNFPNGGGILQSNTTEQQFERIDPQNIPQLSLVDPHPNSIEFEMVPDLPPQQTSSYPQLQ
ncbi:4014_t:CDS:2 [Ambispora gerdemannii]|uniref:4014_t:CDS:1 n=1 Tax=Ambispora gerdemannii TaxID=144530 RepID=A0A9N9A826_9GLOM|nr:4014_t:CDS:2 [Ambispora gerdemannii]